MQFWIWAEFLIFISFLTVSLCLCCRRYKMLVWQLVVLEICGYSWCATNINDLRDLKIPQLNDTCNSPIVFSNGLKVDTYLFNEDGETLIFKGFGELDVLGSFVVYSQRGNNHVSQAPQELSHHAIPLFLVTVVYLKSQKEGISMKISSQPAGV